MMKKCAIIGTDNRLTFLQESLSNSLETNLYPTMCWNDELEQALYKFQPQVIILPIQAMTMDRPISLPLSCEVLFVGKKYKEIETICDRADFQVFYYLEEEQWIWDNANLTAEGFIHYFYLTEKQSLYNKKFIITGYGRVGKRLAFALHHLGANVVISVRSQNQLYEAKSYGFQIEALDYLIEKQKESTDYLINTIPSKWLENADALLFDKVFDLASKPGCLINTETNIPANYVNPTSLPGMYFPKDAGYILARSVVNQLASLEEDK